ncbi:MULTISPECIES: hypothetical protein [Metallosphaera]|uniref:CRISPR-associated protein n=4 Tax=Metallosphaera TaxID=41980 RepID=A4YFX4_METS5|nr:MULTISPECIES: hypothetical protein [Metallosphaera]ABP95326.1 CRISPR-associated protein [Metallosphaera sedula DSM 5348]AIM27312.1 CRISPR-associated protein [Metallosphaera sedula]AKV83173.1 hypothetical protein MsedE_1185 [Metallosphaera sedula]MCY0863089.1 hypothetical protein [Metallosphaera prunae]WPX07365.1 hypothetical protein SOJ17_001128 [Metallosphaera sedula DSM 5348]
MRLNLFQVRIGYATVSSRRIEHYYFSEKDFIPSTTVRGAFLNQLVRDRGLEELERYFFSPGYPIYGRPSGPIHPLAPALGRKRNEYVELPGILQRWGKEDYGKLLAEIVGGSGQERIRPKPKTGDIVVPKSSGKVNFFSRISLDTFIQDNVAIGKGSGSSKTGMLFSYEVKDYGDVWVISNLDVEVTEIHVGRGWTRGLGTGKVVKRGEVDLDLPGPGDVGYCLTPCVPSLLGREFFSAEEVRGTTDIYMSWYTWGKRAGLRPSFKVVREGSIVRVKDVDQDRLMELWPAGLNMMVKVPDMASLLEKVERGLGVRT